jgi:predicted transposase YbfD/YdcC
MVGLRSGNMRYLNFLRCSTNGEMIGIRKIIRVTRFRQIVGTEASEGASVEESYYASNGRLCAARFAESIRDHWFIENNLHNVKDNAFREDFSVRRVNPCIFAIIIDFALNFLRSEKVSYIRTAIKINILDFEAFMGKWHNS